MQKKAPSVIVSSTFYDLKQIRADLANFIVDQLSYAPLLSELNSFPVDPDSDTVNNCRKRVENDADIMVLIIGGRYGYVDKSGTKSITNIEYLTARSKGIPIYVFVQKDVLVLLPIWKDNKTGDFSAAVDDTRIFSFIETIRSIDKVWMFEFETAQNIIDTLRVQFAYMMNEGLSWNIKFKGKRISKDPNLSGDSIKLILERPPAWEYHLFAQSMIDQINALDDIKREYELRLVLGIREKVSVDNFLSWLHLRLEELALIVDVLNRLGSDAIEQSFGPPGQPGDPDEIVFITRKLADIYREAIEWTQRIRRASFDDELLTLQSEMAIFSSSIIDQIGILGSDVKKQLLDFLAMPEPRQHRVIDIKITLSIPNSEKFTSTMKSTYAEILRRRKQ